MTGNSFNPTQITRAGFEYQDLLGIGFLLDLFQEPDLFEWVALDSESAVDGERLGGLDDVIALRGKDGVLLLRQVKFTVDPGREDLELSVDWLLAKRKKGTSSLRKWSDRLLDAVRRGRRVDAALLTNRRPDATLSGAIEGGFLQPDKVLPADWGRLISEIGSEADARTFFAAFRFEHSQPCMDDLERTLRDRVVPEYTDDDGWERLRSAVRTWSISAGRPRAGGHIRHDDLKALLSTRWPKPLSQDFRVPQDYAPPDDDFHRLFRERAEQPGTTVLAGPPGRGKSTYLSHVAQELAEDSWPVVRHHYFLSLSDGAGRSRYVEASYSLVHQMVRLYPELSVRDPRDEDRLREALEEVGRLALAAGKTLVVIVDGLDHVWRDTGENRQLIHLFNVLLPPPPGVSVVAGTQLVEDCHLPPRLLATEPREGWLTLPRMGATAVRRWVEHQADAGRLLPPENWDRADALTEIAKAFEEITGGHPLHLVYSFEALVQRHGPVFPHDVRSLPPCPDGDIRRYYGSLWTELGPDAREMIHVMAVAGFSWPRNGVIECLGGTATIRAWSEIAHLTATRRTGTQPFHESLVAWVRARADHAEAEGRLLPRIIAWLASRDLGDAWRWGWLWIMQARLGAPEELVAGPTREWVMDALCHARPVKEIERVIDAAERAAFARGAYPRVVELRSLRVRLLNGGKLQLQEFAPFLETALRLSGDQWSCSQVVGDLRATDSPELVAAARIFRGEENDVCIAIFDELNDRLRHQAEFGPGLSGPDRDLPRLVAISAANITGFDDSRIVRYVRATGGAAIFQAFVDELVVQKDFERLVRLAGDPNLKGFRRSIILLAIVRLGMVEGVDPRTRPDLGVVFDHPLGTCWSVVRRTGVRRVPSASGPPRPDMRDRFHSRSGIPAYLHTLFFGIVATGLIAAGPFSPRREGPLEGRAWLTGAIAWLEEQALVSAEAIRNGKCPGLEQFLRAENDLSPLPRSARFDERQDESVFQQAVAAIRADLELLRRAGGLASSAIIPLLDSPDNRATGARAASRSLFARGIRLFALDIARHEIEKDLDALDRKVTQFDERATEYLDLARYAIFHGLDAEGARALRSAAGCVLGYGYRKDPAIFELLYAIEACLRAGLAEARGWLAEIAPSVMAIRTYTDGDETRHARGHFAELLAEYRPDWLVSLCEEEAAHARWSDLDDSFEKALRVVPSDSKVGSALFSTLVFRSELKALEARAEKGEPGIGIALSRQLTVTGGMPLASYRRDGYPGRPSEDAPTLDPEGPWLGEYPPDALERFLDEIDGFGSDYERRDAAIEAWLRHWERMGRGDEAVSTLVERTRLARHSYPAERGLDVACDVAFRVFGKEGAYPLFVHAHISRRGWGTWWSSREETLRRLRRVAEVYPERWEDFIRRTSANDNSRLDDWLSIGSDLWVEFFLLVGRPDLAGALTRSMLDSHLRELASQPIPDVPWVFTA